MACDLLPLDRGIRGQLISDLRVSRGL